MRLGAGQTWVSQCANLSLGPADQVPACLRALCDPRQTRRACFFGSPFAGQSLVSFNFKERLRIKPLCRMEAVYALKITNKVSYSPFYKTKPKPLFTNGPLRKPGSLAQPTISASPLSASSSSMAGGEAEAVVDLLAAGVCCGGRERIAICFSRS